MKRLFLGLFYCGFALFGGLVGGYTMTRTAWSLGKDPYKDFQLFTEVFQLIEYRHVAPPSQDKLVHSAIDGMVEQLDAHSHYIPPEKYKIIKKESSGWSVGIGIEVNKERIILRVLPSSPAAKAGLMVGDQLTHIDGLDLSKKSLYKIRELLKGDRGTSIEIQFLRDATTLTQQVIRDHIQSDPVEVIDLEDKQIYIQLERFSSGSIFRMREKIQAFYPPESLRGVILDLRDNPGGFVEEGIALSDLFLKEGALIQVEGKEGAIEQSYQAESHVQDILDAKLIILINGNSASAAELCAGVLQQRERATIIGTESYGKGSMQKVYEFENGAALKLTIAHYILPNGVRISPQTPLTPNQVVRGHLDNPKQELIDIINTLKISDEQKILLTQRLSLLRNSRSSSSIPRSSDFSYRLEHDPQLKTAWNLLNNNK